MKLAWTVVSGPDPVASEICERLELIADTYLSVATPVQKALPSLLRIGSRIREEIRRRLLHNLATLDSMLLTSPVTRLHLEGGWSAILQLPKTDDESMCELDLLNRFNVLVQPGYFFDLPGQSYVVVSLLTSPLDFAYGVERICEYALTR